MHIVLTKYENVVTDFNLSLSSVRIWWLSIVQLWFN